MQVNPIPNCIVVTVLLPEGANISHAIALTEVAFSRDRRAFARHVAARLERALEDFFSDPKNLEKVRDFYKSGGF